MASDKGGDDGYGAESGGSVEESQKMVPEKAPTPNKLKLAITTLTVCAPAKHCRTRDGVAPKSVGFCFRRPPVGLRPSPKE